MDNPKNQLAAKLKEANNVLVTVSANPSVDQLAAAIGLTLFLTKLKKHATTVFSGQIPQTIDFLKPEETIEDNTDSLRDFIISLDKNKADKIRYKVEESMVKIFITPYRTRIDEQDLVFSQGDFNVDVVIGLGVRSREDIDQAIMAHGRILHDATVATLNITDSSDVGTLNWSDPQASSLCEMAVALTDLLKANSLDGQMATALLTGIVAETERFSNEKTSSTTMNASAKLMAAGANQQLVATKLEPPEGELPASGEPQSPDSGSSGDDVSPDAIVDEDGALRIDHESTIQSDDQADNQQKSEPVDMLDNELPEPLMPPLQPDAAGQVDAVDQLAPQADKPSPNQSGRPLLDQPTFVKNDAPFGMPQSESAPGQAPSQEASDEPADTKLVTEPPQFGGQLSAAADDSSEDDSPLNLPPINRPLLSHDPNSPNARRKKLIPKVYEPTEPVESEEPEEAPVAPEPELTHTPIPTPTPTPEPVAAPTAAPPLTMPPNLPKAAEPVQPTPPAPTPPATPLPSPSNETKETGHSFVDMGGKTLEDIEEKVTGRNPTEEAQKGKLPEPFVKSLDNSTLAGIEERVDSPHSKAAPSAAVPEQKEPIDYRKVATEQVAKVMADKTLEDIEEKVTGRNPTEEAQKGKLPEKEDAKPKEQPAVVAPAPAKDRSSGLSYEPHESEPPESLASEQKEAVSASAVAPAPAAVPPADAAEKQPAALEEKPAPAEEKADNQTKTQAGEPKDEPKTEEAKPLAPTADVAEGKAESARDAVMKAIGSSQTPPQRLEGIGASGRMEVSHEGEESVSEAPPPPAAPPPITPVEPEHQTPSPNIHIDENGNLSFPKNLVPTSDTLPKDATAAPGDASAPPTVPPPMMPPAAPVEHHSGR